MTTCTFTGHRPNKLKGYNPEDNRELLWRLHDEIVRHIEEYKVDHFITGMALGIDMWAAEIVLKLKERFPHVKLTAAIPCLNQERKWPEINRKQYKSILDRCDTIHHVSQEEYAPYCMENRNRYMVDNCEYVIGVHDGSKGGTYNCLKYAGKKQRKITTLRP